jgi:hypothetical protein
MTSALLSLLVLAVFLQVGALRLPSIGALKAQEQRSSAFSCDATSRGVNKPAVVASLLGLLLPAMMPSDTAPFLTVPLVPAAADSTGKMSTKLTARKRYLPRIKTGVTQFSALQEAPTAEGIKAFVEGELPGLKRAMNLYGASLRKGEVPDEISRDAEKLTSIFDAEAGKAATVGAGEVSAQLSKAGAALDKYVAFAKIEL